MKILERWSVLLLAEVRTSFAGFRDTGGCGNKKESRQIVVGPRLIRTKFAFFQIIQRLSSGPWPRDRPGHRWVTGTTRSTGIVILVQSVTEATSIVAIWYVTIDTSVGHLRDSSVLTASTTCDNVLTFGPTYVPSIRIRNCIASTSLPMPGWPGKSTEASDLNEDGWSSLGFT